MFVEEVMKEIEEKFDVNSGIDGLKIYMILDIKV